MTEPRRHGPWDAEATAAWLDGMAIPVRLAAVRADGFPLIASLWFLRDGQDLLCAVQEDALVARTLRQEPRCAFEVAPNQPPYMGVRGQARAQLEQQGVADVLEQLIGRYLGDSDAGLANWLRSRVDSEVILRLVPESVSTWDYSDRMSGA